MRDWKNIKRLGAILILVLLSACATHSSSALYEQLGEKPGIDTMTTAILNRVYADERINFLFAETDRKELHRQIVDQICMETGGPCIYEGLPMDEAHSGQNVSRAEFDAFVEDFILGMEDSDVPFRVQNRVLAIFAPMRDQVTYK